MSLSSRLRVGCGSERRGLSCVAACGWRRRAAACGFSVSPSLLPCRSPRSSLSAIGGNGASSSSVVCSASTTKSVSVSSRFAEIRQRGDVAFIPFIVAGDPDLESTKEALLRLDALGADIIEVGVPYSDPLADGPTIQQAATRALDNGATLDNVIAMLAEVSPKIKAPLVTFTYFNPIMSRGPEKFCETIKAAGLSGLLVPDIPLEETVAMREHCKAAGIELVLLTTPTTPADRMSQIAEASEGFIYLVSVTGVTGARAEVSNRVEGLVATLKATTDKPVAVGFGVSKPEHVKQLVSLGADGVIVGSAFVRALGESGSAAEGLDNLEKLGKELKAATAK